MYYNSCNELRISQLERSENMKRELNLALIREQRLKHGFSNEDMAKSLGLASSDKYFRREHGVYKFQASELRALSKKLDIPLEKIFI